MGCPSLARNTRFHTLGVVHASPGQRLVALPPIAMFGMVAKGRSVDRHRPASMCRRQAGGQFQQSCNLGFTQGVVKGELESVAGLVHNRRKRESFSHPDHSGRVYSVGTKERKANRTSPSVGTLDSACHTSVKAIGNLAFLVLVAALAVTTIAACVLPASQTTEEVVDEFNISAPVNLTIDNFAGSVELVGVDGATNIQVAATVHDPDSVKYEVSQNGDTIQVTAEEKNRGNDISRDRLTRKVDIRVRMPTQANMEVRTNIGGIAARHLIGQSELRTTAGDIAVADSQGEFSLETEIGDISAAQVVGEFELHTTAGNIAVADSQGEFSLETEIGDISAAQVVGEFELRTTTGDIAVAGGQGEFSLETEIGDINFTGNFTDQSDNRFRTVSGDIEVTLVEEPNVELQASTHIAGNIHLGQSVSNSSSVSETEISDEGTRLSMAVGSGAADLSLETQSGNIHIEFE